MAAVSEVTTTRIVQSYVSSNSYYGYVPPINETTSSAPAAVPAIKLNQYLYDFKNSKVYLNNEKSDERTNQQNNENGLAMETDDINNGDCKFNCQNNHYVVPEMVMRLENNINTTTNNIGNPEGRGTENSVGFIYRINHSDADAAHFHNNHNNYYYNNINNSGNGINPMEVHRRLNRKRNNYDHSEVAEGFSHGQLKKFRPDGGNKRAYRNTTRSSAGDIGSSAMHYEPTAHLVSTSVRSIPVQTQKINFSCNNYSNNPLELCESGETRVIPRDNTRADENNSVLSATGVNKNSLVDYERMLMETHGCLAYHLHRHQFSDLDHFQPEF